MKNNNSTMMMANIPPEGFQDKFKWTKRVNIANHKVKVIELLTVENKNIKNNDELNDSNRNLEKWTKKTNEINIKSQVSEQQT